ncbi:MAG: hypothetical protein JNK85_10030, partial [Verrucomicrobiales bacterium]|nr:hypothetical protein [Verrucomicrobiales bacterium]
MGSVLFVDLSVRSADLKMGSVDTSVSGWITLHWTGGQGPFAVERSGGLGENFWDADWVSLERTVTLPVGADSRFFRVLDLGPSVTEDNAYLATRMGDRFLEDLAALVRIP